MTRTARLASIVLCAVAVGMGCATTDTDSRNEIRIEVATDGSLTVENESATLVGLGKVLEGLDAKHDAVIMVFPNKEAELKHVTALLGRLRELGYTSVAIAAQQ